MLVSTAQSSQSKGARYAVAGARSTPVLIDVGSS
jgi:hypothetical protein